MILRICEAGVCGPHSLRLTFNDGTTKQVNVRPLLQGAIFEPLREPAYFASMTLDSICGTVVWPNGADFAPEALHELEAETRFWVRRMTIADGVREGWTSRWTEPMSDQAERPVFGICVANLCCAGKN